MAELDELRAACRLGGFTGPEQDERVSRWALARIVELEDALRLIDPENPALAPKDGE